jgi:hypothetical protein
VTRLTRNIAPLAHDADRAESSEARLSGRALERRDVAAIGALLLLGSLPLLNLLALPAFLDEGTYLGWIARVVDQGEWLHPLDDGKPLEVWPMVPFVWLGLRPLIVARVANVLVGAIGAGLVYRLALPLRDRRTAFACGGLFALCPFVVYLQRLALADTFLCVAGVWTLLTAYELVLSPTAKHARRLAVSLVLVACTKLPVGFVFLLSVPLALAIMPSAHRRMLLQRPSRGRLIAAHAPAVLLAVAMAVVMVARLRAAHQAAFGVELVRGIGLGHFPGIAEGLGVDGMSLWGELAAQLSWPVTLLGALGVVACAALGDWRERWLVATGVVPMALIAGGAQFWYSRYLLVALPPLVIGAVLGWARLADRAGRFRGLVLGGVLATCALLMGKQSALLIIDPVAASWSKVDRIQYVEGPSSGYGFPEAAAFLVAAHDAPARIYSLDGHSSYQLRSYLPPSWTARVEPIFYGSTGKRLLTSEGRLAHLVANAPAWVVISDQVLSHYLESTFGPEGARRIEVRPVALFDKPGGHARLGIYAMTPRDGGDGT